MIRIAIVDDHAMVRAGLRQFFSDQSDFSVVAEAVNGHEALDIALDDAPAGLVVADIVAAPRITHLLQDAARLGLPAIEGIGMLLHQAVPGFAAWFGVTPTVDAAAYRAVGQFL